MSITVSYSNMFCSIAPWGNNFNLQKHFLGEKPVTIFSIIIIRYNLPSLLEQRLTHKKAILVQNKQVIYQYDRLVAWIHEPSGSAFSRNMCGMPQVLYTRQV